ncbi:MAG: prolipoprotein diacylglyceryl transferase [Kiritimatiellae bacterium]|nr:prolipoprotein diacylglyceryl transferase [Kiritimatiellia bacterium]
MDRVCCHIGGKPIYWYGVLVAAGLAAAWAHLRRLARRAGFSEELVSNMVLFAMLGGLGGARLVYVVANWPDYASQWIEILRIDHGGLVFYGGVAGAAAALSLHACFARILWRDYADFIITGLPLGHAIGRVGCFLNGCCQGRELSGGPLWWDGRWPVQLMEAASNVIIFFIVNSLYKNRRFRGQVFSAYLLLYPPVRFILEFLRGDQRVSWGGLHVAQWVSLVLFAVGLCLAWVWRSPRLTPPAV